MPWVRQVGFRLGRLFAPRVDECMHGTPSRLLEEFSQKDVAPRNGIMARLNKIEGLEKAKVDTDKEVVREQVSVKPMHPFSLGYLVK